MHLDTHPKRRGLWVSQQFAEECRSAAIQQTQAVEFRLKIFRIDYLGIKRISEWMTGMLCFSMKFTHFAEYFHKLWIRGIFRIYRIFFCIFYNNISFSFPFHRILRCLITCAAISVLNWPWNKFAAALNM